MRSSSIALAVSFLFCLLPLSGNKGDAGLADGKSKDDTLTLTFTGDLLLDRGVRRVIEKSPHPQPLPTEGKGEWGLSDSLHVLDGLFSSSIDSLFRASQVVVANLECPATKIKAPVFKRFIFRAEPEWLHALRHHGITHLNLANNHAIDQGRRGLIDTRRNILAAGMIPVGAGANMQEAVQPVQLAEYPRRVWHLPSVRLMLENFAYLEDRPCVSQEPMDSLLLRVQRLRQSDSLAVIIVSLHWGGEHTLKPVPAQRLDAHRLIDAGADALICHHTHTLQTVETYHGKPIYYSIGNFIFDQQQPLNSRACLVQLTVTADTVAAKTIPIVIQRCQPMVESGNNPVTAEKIP